MNGTDSDDDYNVPATLYRKILGTLLFAAVWPFIVLDLKWFPIGRPAAALIGGALMVIFTIVPQEQVFLVIGEKGNIQTICLLVGMMLLSYYYDREGFLRLAILWIFGQNRPFKHILWKVCALSAVLSAIITNDANCLVVTPLLLAEHMRQNRPRSELPPLLLGIATSSNIGSAATFFGNPQNAFIAANSNVSLLTFFVTSLPAAIIGTIIGTALLYLFYLQTVVGISLWKRRQDAETPQLPVEQKGDIAISLADSRRDLRMSLDNSGYLYLSSQIATEREKMYSTQCTMSTRLPTRLDLRDDYNNYSLPKDFKTGDGLHQRYGATQESLASSDSCIDIKTEQKRLQNPLSPWKGLVAKNKNNSGEDSLTSRNSLELKKEAEDTPTDEGTEQGSEEGEEPRTWRNKVFTVWLIMITCIVVILLAIPPRPTVPAEFNLGLVPLGAGILTMFVDTTLNKKSAYDAIMRIDWPVLMMFWGLFIWLQGFENTGFPKYVFNSANRYMDLSTLQGLLLFVAFVIIGSNVLSNVPLVILVMTELANFKCSHTTDSMCSTRLTGVLLAWVSTIAGNFTLIGSVANLIVAEKGRSCAGFRLTFMEYLRFGFCSTLVVIFTGLPVIYFVGREIPV